MSQSHDSHQGHSQDENDPALFSLDGRAKISTRVTAAFEISENWYEHTQEIKPYLDSAFKHDLKIKTSPDPKKKIPGRSLSVNVEDYRYANFRENGSPDDYNSAEDVSVHRAVTFGYEVGGTFKRVGSLDYVVVDDKSGLVIEVGVGSKDVRQIFEDNLKGREWSPGELKERYRLNALLFKELREEGTPSRKKLDEFIVKRQHDPEWQEKGQFAYYNPKTFDLIDFQKRHGFSDEQMAAARFFERNVSKTGKVTCKPRSGDIVLIPFFNENQEIIQWRMRVCNPKPGEAKYLSFPDDKAERFDADVKRELFQAELLERIKRGEFRNKNIILTEGEFKCHVTTMKTGIVSLGIPGITLVTDTIIKALTESGAASITVVFDNDSEAKALKNADGISNADRAAYQIARKIERAGFKNVKIGSIADTASGAKVGIDDYLLTLTDREAKNWIRRLIRTAKTSEKYAKKIGLDETLHELNERRYECRKTAEQFRTMLKRGGGPKFERLPDEKKAELEERCQIIEGMIQALEAGYRERLAVLYGATRLNLPNKEKYYSLPSKPVPNSDKKEAVLSNGKSMSLDKFSSDILIYVGYPKDLPREHRAKNAPGIELPITMEEINDAFQDNGEFSPGLKELLIRGSESLGRKLSEDTDWEAFRKSVKHREFSLYVLAGHMSKIYPSDEFTMQMHVSLQLFRGNYIDHATNIPLLIQSKTGTVSCIVTMPSWERDTLNPKRAKGIADPQCASEDDSRRRATIRAFLRDPKLLNQQTKFNKIVGICIKDLSGKNQSKLSEFIAPLGISRSLVSIGKDRTMPTVMYATPRDFRRLIRKCEDRNVLMQGVQAGLFSVRDDGVIVPRFMYPVLLLPIKDGQRMSLRVVPLSGFDHYTEALPPTRQLVHTLPGVRNISRSMDPTSMLYRPDPGKRTRGKTILIALNELDALALNSLYADDPDIVVIGLNSDLHPKPEIVSEIKKRRGKRYILVGTYSSTSRYRDLVPEELPYGLPDIYDFARNIARPSASAPGVELSFVPLTEGLTEYLKSYNGDVGALQKARHDILDCARSLYEIAPKAFAKEAANVTEDEDGSKTKLYRLNSEVHENFLRPFVKALETYERRLYTKRDYSVAEMLSIEVDIDKLAARYENLASWSKAHGFELPEDLPHYLMVRYRTSELREPIEYLKIAGKIEGLPRKRFRRDRLKQNRLSQREDRFAKTVMNLFSVDTNPIDPSSMPSSPVEPRWHKLTSGSGRLDYEATQIRRNAVEKLKRTVAKLVKYGVLDPVRPSTYATRQIKGTGTYIGFRKIKFLDPAKDKIFQDIAHSRQGARHCAARAALIELEQILKRKEQELGIDSPRFITRRITRREDLPEDEAKTPEWRRSSLSTARKAVALNHIAKAQEIASTLVRSGVLPKGFLINFDITYDDSTNTYHCSLGTIAWHDFDRGPVLEDSKERFVHPNIRALVKEIYIQNPDPPDESLGWEQFVELAAPDKTKKLSFEIKCSGVSKSQAKQLAAKLFCSTLRRVADDARWQKELAGQKIEERRSR